MSPLYLVLTTGRFVHLTYWLFFILQSSNLLDCFIYDVALRIYCYDIKLCIYSTVGVVILAVDCGTYTFFLTDIT